MKAVKPRVSLSLSLLEVEAAELAKMAKRKRDSDCSCKNPEKKGYDQLNFSIVFTVAVLLYCPNLQVHDMLRFV